MDDYYCNLYNVLVKNDYHYPKLDLKYFSYLCDMCHCVREDGYVTGSK